MTAIDEPMAARTRTESKDAPLASGGPAVFDLSKWVAGVTPARRSETLYQRPDLVAEVDRLSARIAVAGAAERTKLESEAAEVTAALRESALPVVIEGRTSAWVQEHAARMKDRGITDATEVILHQLAEQIVEPDGMTYDLLARLAEVIEPQVTRLVVAMMAANSEAPKLDPRFSRAS